MGVLHVDKPAGPTSHDVVDRARAAFGIRRVGHTGTLDPFATGLLILCAGPATRLAEYFLLPDKRYVADLRLGVETTTHDPEGEVVSESSAWRGIGSERLRSVLSGFTGPIRQLPPTFSAKRLDGDRAHRAARAGETVELDPVTVHVGSLVLEAYDPPRARVSARVGSGTYLRALARDVGRALGCGAHLDALRRTAIGTHDLAAALPLAELTPGGWSEAAAGRGAWIPPSAALPWLARRVLDGGEAERIRHGAAIPAGELETPTADEVGAARAGSREGRRPGPVLLLREGELVAMAELREGRLQPRKVWPDAL